MQRLTEEQRKLWAVDGYVRIEGALSPDQVEFFSAQVDAMRERPGWEPKSGELPRGHYGWVERSANQDPEGFMDRRDILPYHQAFIDLIDQSPVFDLIVDVMGPYICFSMSQAIVRASGDGFPGLHPHRWRRGPAQRPRDRDEPAHRRQGALPPHRRRG